MAAKYEYQEVASLHEDISLLFLLYEQSGRPSQLSQDSHGS